MIITKTKILNGLDISSAMRLAFKYSIEVRNNRYIDIRQSKHY